MILQGRMPMKIAGLDIGTTGCKFTVFDETGKYLNKAYRDYPVKREVSGHETDVSVVMDAVIAVISEMAGKYPDICGIGVTSFGETCVFADKEGRPLCPSMLYTDPRGKEECGELVKSFGEMKIAQITGLRPHEMYSISKIMWVKKHRPDIWEQTKHIFLMADYVVYHLTGVQQIDYSLASRTMAFDIRKLCFAEEILSAAGIKRSLFGTVVPTGTVAGTLTKYASEQTGLKENTIVVTISHDQISAAAGAGALDAETAVDGAGTVECLTPIYNGLPDIKEMYRGYFSVVPYVVPGCYAAYAFSYMGGAMIQWCIDSFGADHKKRAKEENVSVNELLEKEYIKKNGDRPSGLLVLPHLAGAATPYMDSGSRGAVVGLTPDMGIAELYRGCMEGVVYEMLLNMEYLKNTGIRFRKLNATGGGARSSVWMQMKADALNIPITALKTADAGTVGSAMLTGIAAGIFKDLPDAASHMVEETVTYEPVKEKHERYMEVYERYRGLYGAVRPLL